MDLTLRMVNTAISGVRMVFGQVMNVTKAYLSLANSTAGYFSNADTSTPVGDAILCGVTNVTSTTLNSVQSVLQGVINRRHQEAINRRRQEIQR
ncbi:MAG: hypothetical protein J6Y03_02725 [Alphaproteobacteria bacterium]|nr:hypothetical protein [Alphaproteobacteria bacterium]